MLNKFTDITFIIPIAAFLVILLLGLSIIFNILKRINKKDLVQKIQNRGAKENWGSTDENLAETTSQNFFNSALSRFFNAVGQLVMSEKYLGYSQSRIKFLKAGFRRKDVISVYWGSKIVFVILLPLSFLLLRMTLIKPFSTTIMAALYTACAFIGFYLPNIFLFIKSDIRKDKIRKALPDALDLLVVCVEAGMGLDAAIFKVGEEIKFAHPVLSDELTQVNLELRAGKLRKDALRNLALRTDVDDIKSLVGLLIQTDQFGTSIAQALRVFSETFRTKRFLIAEERAAKIPVKLVFPLILFIFPSLMVVLLGPAAIRIYHNIIMR